MAAFTTTRVVRPARRLRGELRVPGDKSITHRAVLLGAIGCGDSRFRAPGVGADTRASLSLVRELGVGWQLSANELVVGGRGLAGLSAPADPLDCGNSGTTMRLAAGLLAGQPFRSTLTGDASLRSRPMDRVIAPLRAMGADVQGECNDTRAPLRFGPAALRGIAYELPVASAQVKSALLLAAIQSEGATLIRQPAPSRDHTERMLRRQGARLDLDGLDIHCEAGGGLAPLDLVIPGDLSSAAYWLAAAALHPDAEVVVRGVGLNPTRSGILDVLRRMGADLSIEVECEEPEPSGTLRVRSSNLRADRVDGAMIPRLIDEAPLVALLGTHAQGTTRIADAAELAVKESNRIAVTAAVLSTLGAEIEACPDGLVVAGAGGTHAGEVDAAGDHRTAMLLAVAGLTGEGPVTIHGADAVEVSYPSFWDDLETLSA